MEFKVGDMVELVNNAGYSALVGATAYVEGVFNELVQVKWINNYHRKYQMHGNYDATLFRLVNSDKVLGVNKDSGKLRVDLVPTSLVRGVAEVLTKACQPGADGNPPKYPERNWEKGIKYSRIYANIMRHMMDWFDGSNKDYESGLHPLKHAACRLAMLIEYDEKGMTELDDRPKKPENSI